MSLEWVRARARENEARARQLAATGAQTGQRHPVFVEMSVQVGPARMVPQIAACLCTGDPAANESMVAPIKPGQPDGRAPAEGFIL